VVLEHKLTECYAAWPYDHLMDIALQLCVLVFVWIAVAKCACRYSAHGTANRVNSGTKPHRLCYRFLSITATGL